MFLNFLQARITRAEVVCIGAILTMISPQISIFAVLLLMISLLLLIARKKNRLSLPSPPKLPLIGNLHQLGSLPHRSLHILSQSFGPLMFLQLGNRQAVVVSSAELAMEIMKTYDHIFASRPSVKAAKILFNDGMDIGFAPHGDHWKKARKLCLTHLLSNKMVQSFQHIREEEVASFMDRISTSSQNVVDMSELLSKFVNKISCRTILGNMTSDEMNKIFCELTREDSFVLGKFSVADYFPVIGWLDELFGFGARCRRLTKRWFAFLEEVIEDILNADDATGNTSFLGVLLSLQNDPNQELNLTRELIIILVHQMILGGMGPTFAALGWGMSELVRNTKVMKKLTDEVREMAIGETRVRAEDLHKMSYLKAVIKEVLRLHSPAPLLAPREAMRNCQVQGYEIPEKTRVIINAWSIGRDAKLWEEPEKFRPERFLNSSVDFRGHDFQLIPFGAGRRICPGLQFAISTLELAFANLVHQFDWQLPNGMKVDDLDMEEAPGMTVHRKERLCLVARKVWN